jgi:hypothetical protein
MEIDIHYYSALEDPAGSSKVLSERRRKIYKEDILFHKNSRHCFVCCAFVNAQKVWWEIIVSEEERSFIPVAPGSANIFSSACSSQHFSKYDLCMTF